MSYKKKKNKKKNQSQGSYKKNYSTAYYPSELTKESRIQIKDEEYELTDIYPDLKYGELLEFTNIYDFGELKYFSRNELEYNRSVRIISIPPKEPSTAKETKEN